MDENCAKAWEYKLFFCIQYRKKIGKEVQLIDLK